MQTNEIFIKITMAAAAAAKSLQSIKVLGVCNVGFDIKDLPGERDFQGDFRDPLVKK